MVTLTDPATGHLERLADKLAQLEQRLLILREMPFDRAQCVLQAETLIKEIHSAERSLLRLREPDSSRQALANGEGQLRTLLQEIDYELAVLHLRTTFLEKHFPDDRAFHQHRLEKMSGEGERLCVLRQRLSYLLGTSGVKA